ncbi:MAG: hypothetical protein WED86_05670 [Chloroflexota bacterium]
MVATMLVLLLGVIGATVLPDQSRAGTPTLRVEPATAAPGERIFVTGEFFTPRASVELRWLSADPPAATLTTSPRGALKTRLVVPDLAPGVYSLSATVIAPAASADVAPAEQTVATAFTVTAPGAASEPEQLTAPPPGGIEAPAASADGHGPTATPEPVVSTPAPVVSTPAPPPPVVSTPAPPPPVTDTPGFRFVITIYNNDGANVALGAMKPYLRSGDIFLVLSGNNGNQLNVAWVNDVAARLVGGVPGTTVYAATAGTANGATLAAGVRWPVTGVAYVYEPNMANEPEFSWDFATTQAHFRTFANAAHARGLLAIGKPTGRPLLENGKVEYGWSYGTLGTIMDVQTPQFQTWCRQGLYPQALDKAISQYRAAGVPLRFYPEISLDLGSINGVPATTAIACSRGAVQRGLQGALVWWAPPYANEAIKYLSAFRSP